VDIPFDEKDRAALRAFIQRGEARLSTIHRVAGAFVSGAGLLTFMPAVLRDPVRSAIGYGVNYAANLWNAYVLTDHVETGVHVFALFSTAWIAAALISIFVPVSALFYLLKDIIKFYFVEHSFDSERNGQTPSTRLKFLPRFSISAIAYPIDEPWSEDVKQNVYRWSKFFVGYSPKSDEYYENLYIRDPGIVPTHRREFSGRSSPVTIVTRKVVKHVNVALGLAALTDNTLLEEASRIEASLTRHILRIRTLILRYTKAVMVVGWTAIVYVGGDIVRGIFALGAGDLHKYEDVSGAIVYPVIYFLWAIGCFVVVRWPIKWIYEHPWMQEPGESKQGGMRYRQRAEENFKYDDHLIRFEKLVRRSCWVAGGLSVLAFSSTIMTNVCASHACEVFITRPQPVVIATPTPMPVTIVAPERRR
jgi:hypothetical protein